LKLWRGDYAIKIQAQQKTVFAEKITKISKDFRPKVVGKLD